MGGGFDTYRSSGFAGSLGCQLFTRCLAWGCHLSPEPRDGTMTLTSSGLTGGLLSKGDEPDDVDVR